MNRQVIDNYHQYRRFTWIYSGIILSVIFLLGIFHYFYYDLKVGGVFWFNLDKERNIPTWFSGSLLLGLGIASIVAYYWESVRNASGQTYFRLPVLWLGFAFVAFFMSLDEMTILHENLFWREVRQNTTKLDESWRYLTQWQVLFAPAIFLVISYMVIFFINRFRLSVSAMLISLIGILCWVLALFLESIRQVFKEMGRSAYQFAMITEEMMEMIGALFLMVTIIVYVIDIACDFTSERRERLGAGARMLTTKAVVGLTGFLGVLLLAGGTAYIFAQDLAEKGAPVPRLIRKVLNSNVKTPPAANRISKGSIWFDDLKSNDSPSFSDKHSLIKELANSLLRGGQPQKISHSVFSKYESPQMVFISLSDGNSPAHVVLGRGNNLNEAINGGLSDLRSILVPEFQGQWLKVDLIGKSQKLPSIMIGRKLPIDHSLMGIGFDRALGIAFLPEELLVNKLVTNRRGFQQKRINRYLLSQRPIISSQFQLNEGDRTDIHSFETSSYFSDKQNSVPLFRGHRLFDKLSSNMLLESARSAGDYLIRATRPDGEFVYSYDPKKDKESEKYNILRHAGTVYAMLELYQTTGEKSLLESAKRGIDYLLTFIRDCKTENDRSNFCVVEKGKVKLGGNALAIIALVKYAEVTESREYLEQMQNLAKWIRGVQLESGEFGTHIQFYDSGEIDDFKSEYYPGEALLALTRIYKIDHSDEWLDIAEKGARFLINLRDSGKLDSELSHDHWLLYALNELYRLRPDPIYLTHSVRIANAIINAQNVQPEVPDWLGSFYRPPRSTPTATRVEGLCAAYQLVRDFGDSKDAQRMLEAIKKGISFQLQTQFRPESVMYLKNPKRSLGGFHRSLTSYEIRIDYVQHNISALLGLYHIANKERSKLAF